MSTRVWGSGCGVYLKVHDTYQPLTTVLITLLIPLKGLIGVIPIISRARSPLISGS